MRTRDEIYNDPRDRIWTPPVEPIRTAMRADITAAQLLAAASDYICPSGRDWWALKGTKPALACLDDLEAEGEPEIRAYHTWQYATGAFRTAVARWIVRNCDKSIAWLVAARSGSIRRADLTALKRRFPHVVRIRAL